MDFLRVLRAPGIAAGTYFAAAKLIQAMVGDRPYEANAILKALAHLLPGRDEHVLPSPTPWVYSRQYLECLGRNLEACMANFITALELNNTTNGSVPALPATSTPLPPGFNSFLTNTMGNIKGGPVVYAGIGAVMYDMLVSRSQGYIVPMAIHALNLVEDNMDLFIDQQYYDAVMEISGLAAEPHPTSFGVWKTTQEESEAFHQGQYSNAVMDGYGWEETDDEENFHQNILNQIQDSLIMLRRIEVKHWRELEELMRASSNQAKKLVRRNNKLRQAVKDAENDARDVINHNHNKLLNAEMKIGKLQDAQNTLESRNKGLEDEVRQLKAQLEQKAKGEESLKDAQADLLTELGEVEEDNGPFTEDDQTIRKDLTITRGELAGSNAKITGLETQAKALHKSMAEALKARDTAIDAKLALEGEYQALEGYCDKVEKEKTEVEEKLTKEQNDHEETRSYLQADLSKLETDYETLEKSYESAAKSANDAVKELVDIKETVTDLEAEVERVKADKASSEDAMKGTSNENKKALAAAEKTIVELHDQMSNQEADNKESEQVLENRIDELQAEQSQANLGNHAKALALQEEIDVLNAEVVAWKETSDARAAEVSVLEKAKNTAFGDKMRLTTENDKLKDEVKKLQAKPTYNGENYNKLDNERRGLQRKVADQKKDLLVVQGDARRLERENAALQKHLQARAKPAPKQDDKDDKKYNKGNDDDGNDDRNGGPNSGAGKSADDKDRQQKEGDDNRIGDSGKDEGDNDDDANKGNQDRQPDSDPSPPTPSQPSKSTSNGKYTQHGAANRSSVPAGALATTTVSDFDPFANDFVSSGSPPPSPFKPSDTPSSGRPIQNGGFDISSAPTDAPVPQKVPSVGGPTTDAVPSQGTNSRSSTPRPPKPSALNASAHDFIPKVRPKRPVPTLQPWHQAYPLCQPSDNCTNSPAEPDIHWGNYVYKHIGKAAAGSGEEVATPISDEELKKREERLAQLVAEGNKKAEDKAEATRKARAARESRFTSHAFPGATPKTEDEQICETVVDELAKLPFESLAQSMWAPKGPQNVQQPTASQGQRRPPSTPAADGTATKPNPKIDHPTPASPPRNPAPTSQVPRGVTGQPNTPPAPFGDRPLRGGQSTGPRNQGPQQRQNVYGQNSGAQGPPQNSWLATGAATGPTPANRRQQQQGYGGRGNFYNGQGGQIDRGNFNNGQGGQQGRGDFNNGQGTQGRGQPTQGPPGEWDPPKKPAAMRNKKKNKNGPPQLPPHLRGNGPGAPPTGGSQPPASGQVPPRCLQDQDENAKEGK